MEATRWSRRPVPVNDRRTRPGIWRRARNRARTATHRSDERGGAISLWVVLMTPVSAFAAVVAMAGPQRLAAESSVQDAADDLAMFAVAWRDGHDMSTGELPAFPPECAARSEQENTDLAMPWRAPSPRWIRPLPTTSWISRRNNACSTISAWSSAHGTPAVPARQTADPADLAASKVELKAVRRLGVAAGRVNGCLRALFRAVARPGVPGRRHGLAARLLQRLPHRVGHDGELLRYAAHDSGRVHVGALRGFWTPDRRFAEVPCRTSEESTDAVVVRDAVHVALAANWQDAGWAAAQVWPDGLPMAAESIGRMSQRDRRRDGSWSVVKQLEVLDNQGRPVWAGSRPDSPIKGAGSVGGAHPAVGLIGRLWGQTPTRLRGPPDAKGPARHLNLDLWSRVWWREETGVVGACSRRARPWAPR